MPEPGCPEIPASGRPMIFRPAKNGALVCVTYDDNTLGNSEIYLKFSSGSY